MRFDTSFSLSGCRSRRRWSWWVGARRCCSCWSGGRREARPGRCGASGRGRPGVGGGWGPAPPAGS